MKSLKNLVIVVGLSAAFIACHDKTQPNYQYFPNMYESVGYETYAESDAFKDGKEGQLLPNHVLKRGYVPYDYPNTNEGYEASKVSLKSPLDSTQVDMEKAKELYIVYCGICHGEKGNGKGNLAVREKILGIPSYADRMVTTGSVFHVITYGLNSMGAYNNQLDTKERWQVSAYVMKLKSEL